MIAHVTQTLNDHAFAFQATSQTGFLHAQLVAEEFTQCVLYTTTCRFDTASDPACVQWLTCNTGFGIDVSRVHAGVLIGDPRHLAFARAHVGCRHVLRWIDKVAFDQLICETARDQLKLMFIILTWINAKTAFGATKRCFNQRTLVRHQRSKRFNFILIDAHRETNATFNRLHMLRVDRPVTGECLNFPAQTYAKAHGVSRVTNPNLLLKPWR